MSLKLLKSFVEKANVDQPLSPFGLYARWLFIYGLRHMFTLNGNKEGLDAIEPLMAKAAGYVPEKQLGSMYKLYEVFRPSYYDIDRSLPKNDAGGVNSWFNSNIRDSSVIPAFEKEVFKNAVYLIKHGKHQNLISRKPVFGKQAMQLSKKLGSVYNQYVMLNKGTAKAFGGKEQIDSLYDRLEAVVKKLTGKKGTKIPTDKIKELKLKNGSDISSLIEYDDIRKELKTLTTSSLYAILHDTHMHVDKVAKEMYRIGFRDLPFVTSKDGYKGHIGVDRKGNISLYTESGKLLHGNISVGSKVVMNPKYDPEQDASYYCMFEAPNAVTKTRIYSAAFKQVKNEEKHIKTTSNAANVSRWVKAWERDLLNKDPMRHVPAAVAMILYLTSARVGTSKESRSLKGGAHTYGISTLRKQHVRISAASIILDYVGKKGMHQKHIMKLDNKVNKRIATILKWLLEGKRKDDLVFSFERPLSRTGAIQEVNPAFFRAYLKSTGVTINPHALRHIRGTELTIKLLGENEWKPAPKNKTLTAKQRDAEDFIKTKILTQVANLLGHKVTKDGKQVPQWRTSVQSYVNPAVLIEWFKERNLGLPKWIPQKLEE